MSRLATHLKAKAAELREGAEEIDFSKTLRSQLRALLEFDDIDQIKGRINVLIAGMPGHNDYLNMSTFTIAHTVAKIFDVLAMSGELQGGSETIMDRAQQKKEMAEWNMKLRTLAARGDHDGWEEAIKQYHAEMMQNDPLATPTDIPGAAGESS